MVVRFHMFDTAVVMIGLRQINEDGKITSARDLVESATKPGSAALFALKVRLPSFTHPARANMFEWMLISRDNRNLHLIGHLSR